jgi:PIN domain nuclease of toxin-antitoxin system
MIVLDTHIWHWWTNQIPGKLSPALCALIEQAQCVGVSSMSCFEMAWLAQHGRIDLGMSFDDWLLQVEHSATVEFLPVTPHIAANAVSLPEYHRDPVDRIIISTAIYHQAQLVSFDGAFPAYIECGLELLNQRSP